MTVDAVPDLRDRVLEEALHGHAILTAEEIAHALYLTPPLRPILDALEDLQEAGVVVRSIDRTGPPVARWSHVPGTYRQIAAESENAVPGGSQAASPSSALDGGEGCSKGVQTDGPPISGLDFSEGRQ